MCSYLQLSLSFNVSSEKLKSQTLHKCHSELKADDNAAEKRKKAQFSVEGKMYEYLIVCIIKRSRLDIVQNQFTFDLCKNVVAPVIPN